MRETESDLFRQLGSIEGESLSSQDMSSVKLDEANAISSLNANSADGTTVATATSGRQSEVQATSKTARSEIGMNNMLDERYSTSGRDRSGTEWLNLAGNPRQYYRSGENSQYTKLVRIDDDLSWPKLNFT